MPLLPLLILILIVIVIAVALAGVRMTITMRMKEGIIGKRDWALQGGDGVAIIKRYASGDFHWHIFRATNCLTEHECLGHATRR